MKASTTMGLSQGLSHMPGFRDESGNRAGRARAGRGARGAHGRCSGGRVDRPARGEPGGDHRLGPGDPEAGGRVAAHHGGAALVVGHRRVHRADGPGRGGHLGPPGRHPAARLAGDRFDCGGCGAGRDGDRRGRHDADDRDRALADRGNPDRRRETATSLSGRRPSTSCAPATASTRPPWHSAFCSATPRSRSAGRPRGRRSCRQWTRHGRSAWSPCRARSSACSSAAAPLSRRGAAQLLVLIALLAAEAIAAALILELVARGLVRRTRSDDPDHRTALRAGPASLRRRPR